jgi:hypothetical protein
MTKYFMKINTCLTSNQAQLFPYAQIQALHSHATIHTDEHFQNLSLTPLQALFIHLYLQAFHGKHRSTQCVHVCTFLLDIHHLLCRTSIASDTPHSLSPTSHCGLSIPGFVFQTYH